MIPVECVSVNFLQTERAQFLRHEEEENTAIVCVVGNPPYSTRAGHSATGIQRHLPMQFVRHATVEYQATIVAFVMPKRCAKVQYYHHAYYYRQAQGNSFIDDNDYNYKSISRKSVIRVVSSAVNVACKAYRPATR